MSRTGLECLRGVSKRLWKSGQKSKGNWTRPILQGGKRCPTGWVSCQRVLGRKTVSTLSRLPPSYLGRKYWNGNQNNPSGLVTLVFGRKLPSTTYTLLLTDKRPVRRKRRPPFPASPDGLSTRSDIYLPNKPDVSYKFTIVNF